MTVASQLKDTDAKLIKDLKSKIQFSRSRVTTFEKLHTYVHFDEIENIDIAHQLAKFLIPHARIEIKNNISHRYRNVTPSMNVYFNYVL